MDTSNKLICVDEVLRMISNSQMDNPFELNTNEGNVWHTAHNSAIDCVKHCPTVDAVEVEHGYWEAAGFDGHGDYKECCSNCKAWSVGDDKLYCPVCGAKMDL